VSPIAVTGGTGFVGQHLLRIATERGLAVRALTRRPQQPQPGVEWVEGALDRPAGLARLCEGVRAVIHIAGVINARTRAEFDVGNVAGTAALVDAVRASGVRRFVHVSSLAAREPELSAYGASKAASERVIEASGLEWTIVRPPAVYGPGDRETLALFRMVKSGVAAVPGHGRASYIEVGDLCRALLALLDAPAAYGRVFEIDDGEPRDHATLARLIGEALGRRAVVIPLPGSALRIGAAVDTLLGRATGRLPKLSFDRARYLAHPDWVARGDELRSLGVWSPSIRLPDGLAATAAWYRMQGWL
jgi:nucleoside-diphosphate-sugar epimerase